MALPDLGIVPSAVREPVTEPRWCHRPSDRTPPERRTFPVSRRYSFLSQTQEVSVLENPLYSVVEDIDGPSRVSMFPDAHTVDVLGVPAEVRRTPQG